MQVFFSSTFNFFFHVRKDHVRKVENCMLFWVLSLKGINIINKNVFILIFKSSSVSIYKYFQKLIIL